MAELCFDALSGALGYCVGGAGGGGGGAFSGVQVIYFGKHGNDANDGLSYATAKLTIAGAIAAAIAGGVGPTKYYALWCEDAGDYAETGLTLPAYSHLHAPQARLSGAGTLITMGNATSLRLGEIYCSSGVAIDTGTGSYVEIDVERLALAGSAVGFYVPSNGTQRIRCSQATVYSGKFLHVTAGNAYVVCDVKWLYVQIGTGIGVHQAGGNFGGRTAVYAEYVRLGADGARAFYQQAARDGLSVQANIVAQASGVTAAIAFDVDGGTVEAVVSDVAGGPVADVAALCNFFGSFGRRNGLVIGTGNRYVTDAGENYQPRGGVNNFRLSWLSSSQVRLGSLTGDPSSVRDENNRGDIEWGSALTADITVSGPGGLQSGSVEAANTWYAVYVIADSQGVNPTTALLIPAGTGFSQPGYDLLRRIGWVRNNSTSNFRRFVCIGNGKRRRYYVDGDMVGSSVVLSSGTATVWTSVSCVAAAPPTAKELLVRYEYQPANTFDDFALRPGGSAVSRPGAPQNIQPVIAAQTEGQDIRAAMLVACSTSQAIDYATQSGGPLTLAIAGYVDEV